jgi:hypothetical protein
MLAKTSAPYKPTHMPLQLRKTNTSASVGTAAAVSAVAVQLLSSQPVQTNGTVNSINSKSHSVSCVFIDGAIKHRHGHTHNAAAHNMQMQRCSKSMCMS